MTSEDTSSFGSREELEGELARLYRIEAPARELLAAQGGRRSATPLLSAMAALRAALKEEPARGAPPVPSAEE